MGYRIPITLGNIEPLAYKPYQPGKIALVCEGGGQRGIFTAGVLDEFLRARFNPFDLYLGTSAGAQNLSAFVCGQPGYARRVITRYTTSIDFFNPLRFVRGGHLIDLDWLIEATANDLPLAMDYAEQHLGDDRQLLMCASRSEDFAPTYFPAKRDNWLEVIKASSAIPGFYRWGVELDGVSYHDGGISDAIPVREAHRRGADTIVVIRTVPSQMFYTPKWMRRMEAMLGESSLQQMVKMLQYHEKSYRRIQRFIEKPPGKVRVFEIYPPKPLASHALGSKVAALNADYHWDGVAAAISWQPSGIGYCPGKIIPIPAKNLLHAVCCSLQILSRLRCLLLQPVIRRLKPVFYCRNHKQIWSLKNH